MTMRSLFDAAHACLRADTPEAKLARTFETAEAFACGELAMPDDAPGPEPIRMPGRPPRPRLVPPREVPKRGLGTREGKAAEMKSLLPSRAVRMRSPNSKATSLSSGNWAFRFTLAD